MGNGHESLGHNGKTVGVASTDVRAQSDCVKLNVSLVSSPFPLIIVSLYPLSELSVLPLSLTLLSLCLYGQNLMLR